MKRAFTLLGLGMSLIFGSAEVGYAQELQRGFAAFDRGDFRTACREFRLLAESGSARAQSMLGAMLLEGQGCDRDYQEAAKWFRRSAEQGEATSQISLGVSYEDGRGVIQDYREAVKWYRSAAEQGYAIAQFNLGRMYASGRGVAKDYAYAHMWYNIAAAPGFLQSAALARDNIAKQMTSAQIAKAHELAAQCLQKNYKNC